MKKSRLWDQLSQSKFSSIDDDFILHFREPGRPNNRLAAWDPYDKSMRFFKFLFFSHLRKKDPAFFATYDLIGRTDIGNPITIKGPSGSQINLDHFFSIEEYFFLKDNMDITSVSNVLEIGAGFGRTAQALLKLIKSIRSYTIIDIPEVLALSHRYLSQVLSAEEFAKLIFIDAMELDDANLVGESYDLVINIDSFQEMQPEIVEFYMRVFIRKARFFYTKNPVGKYRPDSVGITNITDDDLMDVFSLGLSREIIDIFCEDELRLASESATEDYRPSTAHRVLASEPLEMFPYYLNILYVNGLGEA